MCGCPVLDIDLHALFEPYPNAIAILLPMIHVYVSIQYTVSCSLSAYVFWNTRSLNGKSHMWIDKETQRKKKVDSVACTRILKFNICALNASTIYNSSELKWAHGLNPVDEVNIMHSLPHRSHAKNKRQMCIHIVKMYVFSIYD